MKMKSVCIQKNVAIGYAKVYKIMSAMKLVQVISFKKTVKEKLLLSTSAGTSTRMFTYVTGLGVFFYSINSY